MDDFESAAQKAWTAIIGKLRELDASGVKRADLAKMLGHKGRSAVTNWLSNNTTSANATFGDMLRYLSVLDLDVHDFLPVPTMRRLGTHAPIEKVTGTDLISIPVFESAGAGQDIDFFSVEPFKVISVLPRYAVPDVRAIEVRGDSMEPTIKSGAIVGVVPLDGDLAEGQPYLVRRPPFGLVVKRVFLSPDNALILKSDNPAHHDQTIPLEGYDQVIVGKVVWVWQLF